MMVPVEVTTTRIMIRITIQIRAAETMAPEMTVPAVEMLAVETLAAETLEAVMSAEEIPAAEI